jgi:alkylated DNA nucleotide flippase Atl1
MARVEARVASGRGAPDLPPYASDVLDVVELIPPGRVMSYGDIAEYLGAGGPRQVGSVMSHYGGAVAWWRVLRADGTPLPGEEHRALEAYRAERTPLRPGGRRVDMAKARWDGT